MPHPTSQQLAASPALWRRIAKRAQAASRLSVAVLGCSTTSGCGAADPSWRCAPELAWPAQFAAQLRARLPQQLRLTIATHAKGAVDVSYFSQCTSEMLPRDAPADIVLLEAFQNLYGPADGLNLTLAALRRATSDQAAIAFVLWFKPRELAPTSTLRERLIAAARAWHVDVVDVPSAMLLEQQGRGDVGRWYALGGRDHHPNRAGHKLIGHTAARYVASRLEDAAASARPTQERAPTLGGALLPNRSSHNARQQHLHRHGSHQDDLSSSNTAVDEEAPSPPTLKNERPLVERCYAQASRLPVRDLGGWDLVDDGGRKQVLKSGLASTAPGQVLTLGPLAVPNRPAADGAIRCVPSNFQARLGYLLSSAPGQGSLTLACVGACTCRGLKSGFQRASSAPFPLVHTDAAGHARQRDEVSIAVTATTTFVVERRRHLEHHTPSHASLVASVDRSSLRGPSPSDSAPSECLLTIRHVAAKRSGRASNLSWSSRVRVDSLVLSSRATTNLSLAVACPRAPDPICQTIASPVCHQHRAS